MQLPDFEDVSTLEDDIIIKLIEVRHCGNLWTRKPGQWGEVQLIYDIANDICKYRNNNQCKQMHGEDGMNVHVDRHSLSCRGSWEMGLKPGIYEEQTHDVQTA